MFLKRLLTTSSSQKPSNVCSRTQSRDALKCDRIWTVHLLHMEVCVQFMCSYKFQITFFHHSGYDFNLCTRWFRSVWLEIKAMGAASSNIQSKSSIRIKWRNHTGKYLTDKVNCMVTRKLLDIWYVFERSHCVRYTRSLFLLHLGPIAGQKFFLFLRFIVNAKWNIKSNAYAGRIIQQPRDDWDVRSTISIVVPIIVHAELVYMFATLYNFIFFSFIHIFLLWYETKWLTVSPEHILRQAKIIITHYNKL